MMKRQLALVLLLASCGLEPSTDEGPDVVINQPPAPPPIQPPNPGPYKPEWVKDVYPVVLEQCALSGCHSGARFISTENAFKASKSAQVIANGRMPPTYSPNFDLWSDAKKSVLLTFLRD